ncbi:MAG: DUF1848 domain-containing protein [Clostridia bacterium]|nr:DUF1848 domain-containing protein [Clostridia bacterium]
MIINTGQRTDIPAFYSAWFCERLKEGYVLVRNPYDPTLVTRYVLSPEVVDCVGFCTKDPSPMLPHMKLLEPYGQFWYVTITPYGREIEPNVPGKKAVLESFRRLSDIVGPHRVGWRYDPIFLSDDYPVERHVRAFEYMARALEGYTHIAVISFIDLYEKTKRNFPGVKVVAKEDRLVLGKALVEIAAAHGMTVKPCAEGDELAPYGADCSGCMTVADYERAVGERLKVPGHAPARDACACYLSCDIGAYNTCGHLCKYCYANYNARAVQANRRAHDPASPLLIGHLRPEDRVRPANQKSWIDGQISMLDQDPMAGPVLP